MRTRARFSISVELTDVAAGAGAAAGAATEVTGKKLSRSRAPAAMRPGAATRAVVSSIILSWVHCGRELGTVAERSAGVIGAAEKADAEARSPARRTLRSMLLLGCGAFSASARIPTGK